VSLGESKLVLHQVERVRVMAKVAPMCEGCFDDPQRAVAQVLIGMRMAVEMSLCRKCLINLANHPEDWTIWLPLVEEEEENA
jgi:hypothetical protein